jgi:hypothetical protein
MYPVHSPFTGGTVGLPCGTTPRYLDFEHCWDRLKIPAGTLSLRMPGSNVTRNCEMIVDKMHGEWVWFMGDDHTFEPDLLLKLLEHDVDVIVPICARRAPPFLSLLYKDLDVDRDIATIYTWEELAHLDGLVSIAGAGSGGMLIKKYVLDAIPSPRFENGITKTGLVVGEDITLCDKINKAGFTIWADLNLTMGHISPCAIWPVKKDGQWVMEGDFDGRRCQLA